MKFRNLVYPCLVVVLVTLVGIVNATTYNCNGCDDCNNKISLASAGDLIQLTANIIDIDHHCIDFDGQDSITFDCQGNYIGGDNDHLGFGIYLSDTGDGSNNNILKNCNISLFADGIRVSQSTNNTIIDNTVNYNYYDGIVLSESSGNGVINNAANYNTKNYNGIYLYESFNNVITGNTANYHKLSGIYLYKSFNNTFTNNILNYNNDSGIQFYGSSNNTFTNNVVNNNSNDGIHFASIAYTNSIFNNTFCFNSDTDVYEEGGNFGDENTCDTTHWWNDEGTSGCTYSCSAATTTTTTSTTTSTSTSTTLAGECNLPGDYPPCEVVTLSEVIDFINLWVQGQVSLSEVIDLINAWASG